MQNEGNINGCISYLEMKKPVTQSDEYSLPMPSSSNKKDASGKHDGGKGMTVTKRTAHMRPWIPHSSSHLELMFHPKDLQCGTQSSTASVILRMIWNSLCGTTYLTMNYIDPATYGQYDFGDLSGPSYSHS